MTRSTTTILLLLMGLLCACTASPSLTPVASLPDPIASQTQTRAQTESLAPEFTPSLTSTILPTLSPDEWKSMPVVPAGVSPQMIDVYQRGLARGRDPAHFSKFGDCQNILPYYLGMFDSGDYRLGDTYSYLQQTIDHFAGSWGRSSFAVKGGLNVAAVQTLYWTDPENCGSDKSPMACEVEKYNPSIVIISFETWSDKPAGDYEMRMRSLVDYVLSQDVVPILGTKADNMEGDYGINAAIARVTYDYGLPLWNFWGATYPLEGHGVVPDGFHLTGFGTRAYFDDPARMEMAWPWRNLTALQAIDAVYRSLNNLP